MTADSGQSRFDEGKMMSQHGKITYKSKLMIHCIITLPIYFTFIYASMGFSNFISA